MNAMARKTMETLATFFAKLAKHEGRPAVNLVSRWKSSDINQISRAFDTALKRADINLAVDGTTSIQALGNRVADAVAEGLGKHLQRYRLCSCSGQGYPDRRLQRRRDKRSFAFELKAKTRFNPEDTNRMILTSGSGKLRRNFPTGKPICHLLATVMYSKRRLGDRCRVLIKELRFDFLEPWTHVQRRYEASVNQRMLSKGKHATRQLSIRDKVIPKAN